MFAFSPGRRKMLHLLRGGAAVGAVSLWSRATSAAPVTIEQIKKNGILRVGCEAAYVPFTYRDSSGRLSVSMSILSAGISHRSERRPTSLTPNGRGSFPRFMPGVSIWFPR